MDVYYLHAGRFKPSRYICLAKSFTLCFSKKVWLFHLNGLQKFRKPIYGSGEIKKYLWTYCCCI